MAVDVAAFFFGMTVGALGTMVGVGGGFLIVPAIALIEPAWSTRTVTAFSLAVVAANASSGTAAYLRQRRVDVRSVGWFALAAVPGVVLGVLGANTLERGWFDRIFGVLLAAMSAWLAFAPQRMPRRGFGTTQRTLVDDDGRSFAWSFSLRLGMAGSLVVGVVSSLFGIGGGPIQVPFLIAVLNFPEHIATATSHGVLAVTSLVATAIHVAQGDYAGDAVPVLCTAAGAVAGAPIGARVSKLVSGRALVRILAAMLAFIAIRLELPREG